MMSPPSHEGEKEAPSAPLRYRAAMSWVRAAALVGFLAVVLGAFGAHGLKGKIAPALLEAWQTGVLYHLVHAGVLLALALYARAAHVNVTLPAGLFVAGVVLFSGSLYVMALTGVTQLGMVTPIGGLCLLAGWLAIMVKLA